MLSETSKKLAGGNAPVPKATTIRHNEVDLRIYSIGWLCYMSRAAGVTIRLWERQKVLPRPIFTINDCRWYTAAEIRAYASIIYNHFRDPEKSTDKLRANLATVHVATRREYKNLTVASAKANPLLVALPEEAQIAALMKNKRKERIKQEREIFCGALTKVTNEDNQNSK